jgi:hypothetical protein
MFITQLLDHQGHFIIKRLGIQPCLDPGLVSCFYLIPVLPIVVRVYIDRFNYISKLLEDTMLLRL